MQLTKEQLQYGQLPDGAFEAAAWTAALNLAEQVITLCRGNRKRCCWRFRRRSLRLIRENACMAIHEVSFQSHPDMSWKTTGELPDELRIRTVEAAKGFVTTCASTECIRDRENTEKVVK